MSPSRALSSVASGVLVLALGTACSSADDDTAPEARPSASVSAAPPPPAAPRVGSCHELTVREAAEPVEVGGAVPCRRPHTSVTIAVGELTPLADGHLLAVDSRTVRAQIAEACPDDPGPFVGGDRTTQRLSRFEVVWFGPTLEQADAGANWYRCDVVALRAENQLLPLPPRLKGVLDAPGALDRYGTCGTTAPDRPEFVRVACSEEHTWRAVDLVPLPQRAAYDGRALAAAGDAACQDIAAQRAGGELEYAWSFERPTREQWADGQRYGYCWVPEA